MKLKTEKLRTLLFRKGITQTQLAEDSGLSRRTITQICNGKNCHESTALLIAGALGVDLNTIKAKS